VHGLTGSRLTTWTYESNNKSGRSDKPWPELFLKDDIPNARILTFGYDANVVNFLSAASQNRIREHASSLNATLSDLRDGTETVSILPAAKVYKFTNFELTQNNRPIIMVAHSLGGILCKEVFIVELCLHNGQHG
jgi:protein SERAC1